MAPPSKQRLFVCPFCAEEDAPFDARNQSNGYAHLLAVHPLKLFPARMLGWHDPGVLAQYRAFMHGRSRTPAPIFMLGVKWKYLQHMLPGAAHDKGYEIRSASFCEQLANNLPVIIGFSCLAKAAPGLSDYFKGKIVMLATVIACTDDLEGVPAEYLAKKKGPQMKLVLGGRVMLDPPVDFQNGQAIEAECLYTLHPEAQNAIRAGVRRISRPYASELAAVVCSKSPVTAPSEPAEPAKEAKETAKPAKPPAKPPAEPSVRANKDGDGARKRAKVRAAPARAAPAEPSDTHLRFRREDAQLMQAVGERALALFDLMTRRLDEAECATPAAHGAGILISLSELSGLNDAINELADHGARAVEDPTTSGP